MKAYFKLTCSIFYLQTTHSVRKAALLHSCGVLFIMVNNRQKPRWQDKWQSPKVIVVQSLHLSAVLILSVYCSCCGCSGNLLSGERSAGGCWRVQKTTYTYRQFQINKPNLT